MGAVVLFVIVVVFLMSVLPFASPLWCQVGTRLQTCLCVYTTKFELSWLGVVGVVVAVLLWRGARICHVSSGHALRRTRAPACVFATCRTGTHSGGHALRRAPGQAVRQPAGQPAGQPKIQKKILKIHKIQKNHKQAVRQPAGQPAGPRKIQKITTNSIKFKQFRDKP